MRANEALTDSPPAMSLADRVAAAIRAEMGWQQLSNAEVAKRVGENEMWVSRKKRGRAPITLDDLERFADALGVDAHDLLLAPTRRRESTRYSTPLAERAHDTLRPAHPRPGHATVTLAGQPTMTSIARPITGRDAQPHNRRPARLHTRHEDGDRR